MPKFKVLKSGVNESLLQATQQKVEKYMTELFHDYEIVKIDDFYTFTFGTITVTVQVLPWHSEDVLVKVYSYLGDEEMELSQEMKDELLRLNATIPFGGFGVTFEGQPMFSYSLAGANLDMNEFQAAVQMVAKTADEYDELVKGAEIAVE
ncbi:MAG: YbjN domain-containing protein [Bacteroidia bacterium]|nr:YbjN domain-containing protein [Bacteroidia bacterium]